MGFFKPLRRKIGLVSLLIACAFSGLWVRSLYVSDLVSRLTGTSFHFLSSSMGDFRWQSDFQKDLIDPRLRNQGWRTFIHPDALQIPDEFSQSSTKWRWQFGPAIIGKTELYGTTSFHLRFSYWSIIIPLTLLSAWLLLSKTRQNPSTPPQDAHK